MNVLNQSTRDCHDKPEGKVLGWTKGGGNEGQHALRFSGLVMPLLHPPHAMQHGNHKVGAKEQAHNREALPLSVQRTLSVPRERDAARGVLRHRIVAAQQ